MSVYLDATLRPLLRENDFAQEGWRIGPKNMSGVDAGRTLEDTTNPLVFKGVVYNEMKGQMSDESYLYYIRFHSHIFPALHNSGGDPQEMTELTYEQLKSFHASHYHPSNAKVITYGDLPVKEHLKELDEQFRQFNKISGDRELKRPISLAEGPHHVTVKGPIDPLTDKSTQYKTSETWLMGDSSDLVEMFSLGIMVSLLLDGYGSPLYRNLIEAGLGSDWTSNTGFDTSSKVGIFSIGVTGVKQGEVPNVRETICKTLRDMHQKGFDKMKVDGLLHQLEIGLKHKNAQFGLNLSQRLKPGWFNGVHPFDALAWDSTLSAFKQLYTQPGYLENLLQKYLLNDNSLTFTMEPTESYSEALASEESLRLQAKLREVEKQVGGKELARKHLVERELQLVEVQEKAQSANLDCLPTLHVTDIPRNFERKVVQDAPVNNTSVQWRAAPTNGLTYFRLINQIPELPHELRMFVPLFADAIMRLGTRQKSMEQLEDLIKLKTGGIKAGYHLSTSPDDIQKSVEGFAFSGSAFDRNISATYDLLRTVILETDFDSPEAENKIRELIQTAASGAISGIAESGHAYARRFAEAGLTPEGRLKEEIAGLTQVRLYTGLAARSPTEGLRDVVTKLKVIQELAIRPANLRVAITCGPESLALNEGALQNFLDTLPKSHNDFFSQSRQRSLDYPENRRTFFPLPYQVYYTGLAIPTVAYTNPDGAPLQILAQLLTHKHLLHEIREKGGAYGGGAYAKGVAGVFGFYSYRDPNPQNTLKVISAAGTWARDKSWSSRDIEEAKLSVFQSIDAPESVSEEGMTRFIQGVDDHMLQRRREQLLDVTVENVQLAAQKYLIDRFDKAKLALLGETRDWITSSDWKISDIGMPASDSGTS